MCESLDSPHTVTARQSANLVFDTTKDHVQNTVLGTITVVLDDTAFSSVLAVELHSHCTRTDDDFVIARHTNTRMHKQCRLEASTEAQ